MTRVADELLVLVHRADRHHARMAVGAPDAPARPVVGAAAPVGAGAAAVPGGEEDDDPLVERLHDLARERVVRVARVRRVPRLLEDSPAVREDVRRPVDLVLVDRPLERLQRAGDRRGDVRRARDPQVVDLGVGCHAEDVGRRHVPVLAPAARLGAPVRGRPAADHARYAPRRLAGLDRPPLSGDAAVDHADDHAGAAEPGGPDLGDAQVVRDVGHRALRRPRAAVARRDRARLVRGDRRVLPDLDDVGSLAQLRHCRFVVDLRADDVGGRARDAEAHGRLQGASAERYRLELLVQLEAAHRLLPERGRRDHRRRPRRRDHLDEDAQLAGVVAQLRRLLLRLDVGPHALRRGLRPLPPRSRHLTCPPCLRR